MSHFAPFNHRYIILNGCRICVEHIEETQPEKPARDTSAIEALEYDVRRYEIMNNKETK